MCLIFLAYTDIYLSTANCWCRSIKSCLLEWKTQSSVQFSYEMENALAKTLVYNNKVLTFSKKKVILCNKCLEQERVNYLNGKRIYLVYSSAGAV